MTRDEIRQMFSALDLRERLICKMAVLGGLRPGEILGLRRPRISEDSVSIHERVYRGQVDTQDAAIGS